MTSRRISQWSLNASLLTVMVVAALAGTFLHRHLVGPNVTDREYAQWQRWIPGIHLALLVSTSAGACLAVRVLLWAVRGRRRPEG